MNKKTPSKTSPAQRAKPAGPVKTTKAVKTAGVAKPNRRAKPAKPAAPPDPVCRPLDQWVAYRFGLIAARMGVIGQRAYQGNHKLSTSAWRAMAVVARYEPCSAAELSSHSRLDPPKVSRAIEVLTQRKLLQRNKDPLDQRRAVLTLTPRGRQMYDSISTQVERTESFMTGTLTADETKTLWTIVGKIDAQVAKYLHPDTPLPDDE